MTVTCQECGAPCSHEVNCTARFHRFMALEMTSPAYGAVHHLTVAAYMLQHPSQLSKRGWQEMRELLRQIVLDDLRPSTVRTQRRSEFDSRKRDWSLSKGQRMMLPATFVWTLTILNVDASTSEQYCREVERWARQVFIDASSLDVIVKEHSN